MRAAITPIRVWFTTNSIANYSYLVRKVAFPIHILPAVPLCAALFVHAVLFVDRIGN